MMFHATRRGVLVVLLALVVVVAGDGDHWEVRTNSGVVRGTQASYGNNFSFLGIPFGAPPTGDNRFKAPRPAAPWPGVLDANASRLCVQPKYDGGQEDCLTLDVFAPARAARPLPVLVYFYGGAYLFNTRPLTTKAVGPLLSHGIIVVTVNYRVGVLGFLCLGIKEAPGNAGLRDQLLGLQWVQNNIAAFGGDPSRVTAAGTSAGGGSVHVLAAAPETHHLFQRGISIDGVSVSEKTFMTYPITNARKFARLIDFDSDDVAELAKFYKEVPVETLVKHGKEFSQLDNGESGFSPCVERHVLGVRPVVDDAPALTLYRNKRPMLFTTTDYEGSLRVDDLVKNKRDYNTDFPAFSAANLDFPNDEVKYEVSNKTKAFYFGNKNISEETVVEFGNFWGDRQIVYQTVYSAREHAKLGNSAHLLHFTYVGNLSSPKTLPMVPGASHGDLFNYLFPEREPDNADDRTTVERVVSIIAQFIINGSAPWPPASPRSDRLSYLRVGKEVTSHHHPMPAPLAFWDRIYQQYRRDDYWPYRDEDNLLDFDVFSP